MADETQYQGSQAFNQSLQATDGVNKNTGSPVITVPLASLKGVTKAVDLDVTVRYAPGTSAVLGMPPGWDLGIPFIFNGQSLTTRGKTYVIDPNWTDATAYGSGLRYVNDHGMRFTDNISAQPAPHGNAGNYRYTCQYSDGIIEYFDPSGKLIERADQFGNFIVFSYTDPGKPVTATTLSTIVDSFGQTVSFGRAHDQIIVQLPAGITYTLIYNANGISQIQGPLGLTASISYNSQVGQTVVSTVQYLNGLVSKFQYTTIRYLDASGHTQQFPAVRYLFRQDLAGTLLQYTAYTYGQATNGATFTGAIFGYRMSSSSDSLMESENLNYRYDVLEQHFDATGKQLSVNQTFFNYLHLPVTEKSFLLDENNSAVEAKQTVYTYPDSTGTHGKTVNFFRPTTIEQFDYNATDKNYVPAAKSETSYDDFGNTLISTQFQYDRAQSAYATISERQHVYQATADGRTMPQTVTVIDHVTGAQRQLSYTLTTDHKSIASVTSALRANADAAWSPFKTKSFGYDNLGRNTTWTTVWADGYPGPAGTIASVGGSTDYAYDSTSGTLTVTSTDALGLSAASVFDVTRSQAPVVSLISATKATQSFEYDAIGRRTKYTDALGRVTSTAYTFASDTDPLNYVETTGPTAYKTRHAVNAIGQLISVTDNGDPTSDGSTLSRPLLSKTYDLIGNVLSSTDELGLVTTTQYDGLSRPISSTDPLGNTTAIAYDDIALTITKSLNGDLRSTSTMNGLGLAVVQESHPDSGDAQLGYFKRSVTAYDGFGQVSSEASFVVDKASGTATQEADLDYTYDADGNLLTMTFTGATGDPAMAATATTSHVYDLVGNRTSSSRTVTYGSGEHYQTDSEVYVYDKVGNLVQATNQLGQVESFAYDDNRRLITLTRYDGSTADTTYYDDDAIETHTVGGRKTSYTYLDNGLVETKSRDGATLAYDYYLDGSAKSVTFPDGRSIAWQLDKYSRVLSQTDCAGLVQSNTFDQYGRFESRTIGNTAISFGYDVVNHAKGQLNSLSLTGGASRTWCYAFDGYGDARTTTIQDSTNRTILKAAYTRNSWRWLSSVALSSDLTEDQAVNCREQFVYDGLGQVRSHTRTPTAGTVQTATFAYDGSSNVVSRIDDGTPSAFSYNAINQIQGAGVTYDTLGRMTADGLGKSFAFDADDLLQSVTDSGGTTLSASYYADGLLRSAADQAGTTTFYYQGGAANTVSAVPNGGTETLSSLFTATDTKVASIAADQSATYLSDANRSTRLVDSGSGSPLSLGFDAYGSMVASATVPAALQFLWNQEYQLQKSGLVYLRARWYHPVLRQFITMDPSQTGNRYGYGQGDPINTIDPLGEDAIETFGIVAGLIVGAVVTGGVGAALIGGAEVSATACVAAGAVAGAAGSVAGDAVTHWITGKRYSLGDLGIDLLAGAVGGAVAAGAGGAAAKRVSVARRGWRAGSVKVIKVVTSGLVGGSFGAAAACGVTSVAYHQPYFSSDTALTILEGAAGGIASDALADYAGERLAARRKARQANVHDAVQNEDVKAPAQIEQAREKPVEGEPKELREAGNDGDDADGSNRRENFELTRAQRQAFLDKVSAARLRRAPGRPGRSQSMAEASKSSIGSNPGGVDRRLSLDARSCSGNLGHGREIAAVQQRLNFAGRSARKLDETA